MTISTDNCILSVIITDILTCKQLKGNYRELKNIRGLK